MADVATVAEENIVGVHVVKAFAQEAEEEQKFARRSDEVFAESVRANRQRALYVPLLAFVPLVAQAGVLRAGGGEVGRDGRTIGAFFFFHNLVEVPPLPAREVAVCGGP